MPRGYPAELRHVGDHIRRRRLELGLRQCDLAARFSVSVEAIASWESGTRRPSIRLWLGVLGLLGYDPVSADGGFRARLEAARRRLGATQREFAAMIGVNEGTIGRWSAERRRPRAGTARWVEVALQRLEPDRHELEPVDQE